MESVRLTILEKQYFTPVLTCSNRSKTFHACLQLFTPFTACSHLFTAVHSCSQLFMLVHTCSHLFTPLHTSLTIYALRVMAASRWIFPCESRNFSILRAIFLKLHIFAHLIESYPTVHGLSSCVEKKYIDPSGSPYYSDHVRSSHSVIFLHFRMLLFFSVTSYPAEIAHFNSPNREL